MEELIAKSGQSKDNIHNDVNAYRALKWWIDNPDSCHDNDEIWRMQDLHNVFLLGKSIHNRQQKINAARKAAAAATATATATAAAAAMPHPMLQIPPYLHMPLQQIHLHLL